MKRFIIWEKWMNPLGGGKEYSDEPLDDASTWADEYEKNDPDDFPVRAVIPSSYGVIPVSIYGDWPRQFNWHMAHTSFVVTKGMVKRLKKVLGVETLDPVSDYRFRVGVGKCFDPEEVKIEIEEVLYAPRPLPGEYNPVDVYLSRETREELLDVIDEVSEKFKDWSIYLLPNGRVDILGYVAGEEEKFQRGLLLHQGAIDMVGGVLYTSDAIEKSEQ